MAEREAPGAPAFRFAAPADSAALLKIYGEYLDTPITFECALPSRSRLKAFYPCGNAHQPFRIQQRPKEPRQAGDRDGARKAVRLMFQPHADIVFASLAGSDVARQYGLARRPECLIESVSVSEIPLPKKLGHEGMPGKVAEKGNPQNVHDDLRGGYLSWKPRRGSGRSGPISTVCPD